MSEQNKKALQIEYDADMDRFYIPVNSRYEIQTKGKGSSFRIANTSTHIRNLVADEHLHEMIEDMARGTNAELLQSMAATAEANKRIEALEGEVAELKEQLSILKPHPLCDTSCLLSCSMEADYAEKQYLENQQLQASKNDLREALEKVKAQNDKYGKDGHIDHVVVNALYATPAESLQAHDDEVIEKAFTPTEKVIVAIENEVQSQLVASGINEVMHRLDGQYIFDAAIRALKEVK